MRYSLILIFVILVNLMPGLAELRHPRGVYNRVLPSSGAFRSDVLFKKHTAKSEDEKKEGESILRRFEIVYLISFPLAFFYSYGLMLMCNRIAGLTSGMTAPQWLYIGFNSILIPGYIAYKDLKDYEK